MRKFEVPEKKRHISIRAINLSLVVVVVLFSTIVECISILVEKQYTAAADVQNTYTICSDAADVLQKESDNLSFAIEEYVIAQDLDAVERYFEIIDGELREHEVERAKEREVDCSALEAALSLSNELVERELHARRKECRKYPAAGERVSLVGVGITDAWRRKEAGSKGIDPWEGVY